MTRLALAVGSLVAVVGLVAPACAHRPVEASRGATERGEASWYGHPYHGRRTASGEIYDMNRLTAAHRTLPFGTVVEVRRLDDGRSVSVTITDRGPFVRGRIVDLSHAAACRIGLDVDGVTAVELRVLAPPRAGRAAERRSGTATASGSNGCRRIQAGAYRSEQGAESIARRLRDAGLVVEVITAGDGLTRVRVDPDGRPVEAVRRTVREIAGEALVVGCR